MMFLAGVHIHRDEIVQRLIIALVVEIVHVDDLPYQLFGGYKVLLIYHILYREVIAFDLSLSYRVAG